ncbi:unnamed protein product, partial [Didymodactylos carnosus]
MNAMMKKLNLKDYLSEDGKLDLSIMNLKAVPPIKEIDDFVKLENIHTLDLSKNKLTSLPDNFGLMKSLKQLDLFDNRIRTLPISFCELTNLEYLDLKNNALEEEWNEKAGKCITQKECRECAKNVVQYAAELMKVFEKEQQLKMKKKMAQDKIKQKKEEKIRQQQREQKKLEKEVRRRAILEAGQQEYEGKDNTDRIDSKLNVAHTTKRTLPVHGF